MASDFRNIKQNEIRFILENASDSEGDDVDPNCVDSDYEDNFSEASETEDMMTVDPPPAAPPRNNRRIVDTPMAPNNPKRRQVAAPSPVLFEDPKSLEAETTLNNTVSSPEMQDNRDPYEFDDDMDISRGTDRRTYPSAMQRNATLNGNFRRTRVDDSQPSTSGMQRATRAGVQQQNQALLQTGPNVVDADDAPAVPNNAADPQAQNTTFVGKDGTVWDKFPPATGRARRNNIRRDNGPRANIPPTTAITNPVDAFLLFIQPILHLIVMYTNIRAQRIHAENDYNTPWKDCDEVEIKAFIGLVLLAGVLRQSKHSLTELWSATLGPPIFRATMSLHRFKQLSRFLRFDDKDLRLADEKFAPIREVWETVNSLFGRYFIPGDNITVDEQLLPYRGRCGFRQYMPSKPDKYGIKFWIATCSETYYPLNTIPYLGREGNQRAVGLGSQVVLSLTEPYYNTGRNVTCDNYFTSYALAMELQGKGLTLLGTVKKNKTFLPEEFKPSRRRPLASSVFGFTYDSTIVSYVPSIGKSVALLSTMHHDNKIDAETGKPEIIMDYNATKGGVDTLDQMAHTYTSKRSVKRWPMAVFYNLLDLCGIAAYVIWTIMYPDWKRTQKNFRRRLFLYDVACSLLYPQIGRRYQTMRHKHTRAAMDQVLQGFNDEGMQNNEDDDAALPVNEPKRSRCHMCAANRRSKLRCDTCDKPVCNEHSKVTRICSSCS